MNQTQDQFPPAISVVVPVYKTAKYLDGCVESILNQTLRDIEVILVDDGSPDECPAMCDAWMQRDERVSVLHQKNKGLRAAVIKGIMLAKAEYVAFVDSDDWIEAPMLEEMYAAAKQYNADCVRCGIRMINPDGSELLVKCDNLQVYDQKQIEQKILSPFWERDANLYINWSNGRWDKLFRASILKQILPQLDKSVSMGEDVELNLRVLPLCQRIVSLPNACYYCNFQNPNSMTHGFSNKLVEQNEQYLKALEKLKNEQNRSGKALRTLSDRLYAWVVFQALTCEKGNKNERCRLIEAAIKKVQNSQIYDTEFAQANFAVRRGMRLIKNGHVAQAVLIYSSLIQVVRMVRKKLRR